MNKFASLIFVLALTFGFQSAYSQTADEVIATYLETIGGADNIAKVKSMKLTAKGKAQGMDLPITMYQKSPQKQRMDMVFQGKEITQMAFDGKTGWSHNFMTMEPEKWDQEQSDLMRNTLDFPEPFLNYQDKGYSISMEGEEEIEGTMCYKIKLTRKPVTVEGKEEENFSFFFFDKDTNVPIMQREFQKTGPAKDKAVDTFLSDYDEVAGIYYPHTMSQKIDGTPVWDMTIENIEVNVDIKDALFLFPETAAAPAAAGDNK